MLYIQNEQLIKNKRKKNMDITITSLRDIEQIISDVPIDPDFYHEYYFEIVAELYMGYILDHGFEWEGENVDVPEDVIWGFFAEAELPDEDEDTELEDDNDELEDDNDDNK